MPYIGKTPTVGNFQVCDAISVVNGQAAYTLQVGGVNVAPESANHMLVSLNGILQKPGSSFTISGSTMTFASNLATGDSIDFVQILGNVLDLGQPSDDTVSTAKIVDNAVTAAKMFSTFKNGITEADQWRLTATITSNVDPIASNLERVDDASFAKIGTGMSVSSGYWSFPSTGLWMVRTDIGCNLSGDDNVRIDVYATTNNSSYDLIAYAFGGANAGSTSNTANTTNYVNVTDTSNVKVKFGAGSIGSGSGMAGDSNFNYSSFTFIRLGDSQ